MTDGTAPSAAELFEHAPCGLLLAGVDGVIVRMNGTMRGWIGRADDDLAGTRLASLFTVGGRMFHQTHCLPMLQMQGSVAEVQVDVVHRDGTRLPMLMNIVRRQGPDGAWDEAAFFVATERRSYERELLQARQTAEAALEARRGAEAQLLEMNATLSRADRRKDEFLATLAHELRNPLAPIANVIALLKHQLPAGTAPAQPLEILERQVGQLTHLVDDLLEISRVTLGHVDLRCATVDLGQAVQAAAGDMRQLAAGAGHRLHVQLPPAPVTLHADPTRLTQVIVNLLTNAVKYTPDGGDIWLGAERQGEQAVITVRDSGIGIAPESLGTVFHMFSQLTPALDRAQGGLGIGLALVRGLVELHGGSIGASSDGPGRGSVFTVRLPALAEVPAAAPAPACSAVPVRARRILVVDDNADVVDTMQLLLEAVGHATCAAHNGAQAIRTAQSWQPDVIILDIGLPDLNGYEVARRLRACDWGRAVHLIAATGWGQDADRQLARDAGFDLHLTKPIDFERLCGVLDSLGHSPA